MPQLEKTIYIGAFVHCKTLTELEICTDGAIGVDESGKIVFLSRSNGNERSSYPSDEGWEQAKTVKAPEHGFFFPGFIGMSFIQPISFVRTGTKVKRQMLFLVSRRYHVQLFLLQIDNTNAQIHTSTLPNIRTQASSANRHYSTGSTPTRSLWNHRSPISTRRGRYTTVSSHARSRTGPPQPATMPPSMSQPPICWRTSVRREDNAPSWGECAWTG